jgi:hypothetical protein
LVLNLQLSIRGDFPENPQYTSLTANDRLVPLRVARVWHDIPTGRSPRGGWPVSVEVHLSDGLAGFTIVELSDVPLDSRTACGPALISSELPWRLRRVTVDLASFQTALW